MSRNSEYEARQKAKGLKKVALWIPEHCEDEFKLMAQSCSDNRDLIPFMCRSIKTGQMRKGD